MALFGYLMAFGVVGMIIGALAMIPLRRWVINRMRAGRVAVWGQNSSTGLKEIHWVRPEGSMLPIKTNAGVELSVPVHAAGAGQWGNAKCFDVDLADGVQLVVNPDQDVQRLSAKWIRDTVKRELMPSIDGIHAPKKRREGLLVVLGLVAIALLVIIVGGLLYAEIQGIEVTRQAVGDVIRT